MIDSTRLTEIEARLDIRDGFWDEADCDDVRWLLSALHASQKDTERLDARVAELEDGMRDIRDNYDHEEQTHDHQPFRYGGKCRSCTAENLLASHPVPHQEPTAPATLRGIPILGTLNGSPRVIDPPMPVAPRPWCQCGHVFEGHTPFGLWCIQCGCAAYVAAT